jgi:hypothetical protein
MENIVDMIIADESPSNISDEIKSALFKKSIEKIEALKPGIADSMFNNMEME